MAVPIIQPSFAAGELAPSLHARVDLAKFQTGARQLLNFFVHAHGGVSNRPGLEFVGEVRDSTKAARLLPFAFSTVQTYALAFGDQVMQVVKEGGLVLEDAKTVTGATQADPVVVTAAAHGFADGDHVYMSDVVGMARLNGRVFKVASAATDSFALQDPGGTDIDGTGFAAYVSGGNAARVHAPATPFAEADLARLKYTQSADVMTLCHPSHAVRELSRTGHAAWSFAEVTFEPETARPTGMTVTPANSGSASHRYRVTASNPDSGEESLPALNNNAKAISGATQADPVVITATGHGFDNGDEVYLDGIAGMTELNGRNFVVSNKATNTFELRDTDGTGFAAYVSGGQARRTFAVTTAAATLSSSNYIDVAWSAVAGIESYNVYREKNGIYGFIGRATGTSFRDDNIEPDTGDSPPQARNPFVGAGNHPSCVTFYEQRRTFAASSNKPQTLFLTQPASYRNMSVSSPTRDSDAITRTIAANQVNEIRHLVPLTSLIALTSGGEWSIAAGANSDAITPLSMQVKPQSYYGSSHVPPVVIGNTVLFVQEKGAIVRDLLFDLQVDGFQGNDLSILANHLFQGHRIVEWAFAQAPYSIIWAVREDGILLSFTYMREHQVWAWCRHETKGKFESVCVISEGQEDSVYFIVRRKIGGRLVRYVERLHSRLFDDARDAFFVDSGRSLDLPVTVAGYTNASPVIVTAPSHGFADGDLVDIADLVSVDSGGMRTGCPLNDTRFRVASASADTFALTHEFSGADIDGSEHPLYDSGGTARKAVSVISGLDHLEGQRVTGLADGNVIADKLVSDGAITLDRPASRVHVGLAYAADLETLNVEVQPTIQGKRKKVSKVTLRVEKTRGLAVGPEAASLKDIKPPRPQRWSQPGALVTDDLEIVIDPVWNSNGRITVRQANPLPATILAVVPDLDVGA